MDYTQVTVRTNQHEGIINPYLNQIFRLSSRAVLRLESHILAYATKPSSGFSSLANMSRIYGYENDLRFIYTPNSTAKIEVAFMALIPTNTLLQLPMGQNGDASRIAHFAYFTTTWTPKILNIKS